MKKKAGLITCLQIMLCLKNKHLNQNEIKTNKLLNQSVHSFVEASWKSVESKQSLKYVNPHRSESMEKSTRLVFSKILLTGTYILQGNRAAFNQYEVDPTCKLCSTAPETRQHFIAKCTSFLTERQNSLKRPKITQS